MLVGVSGLNSSYDYLRLREIFRGSRRQSASTLHVIPSIDQPITDVIANLVLNRLDKLNNADYGPVNPTARQRHERSIDPYHKGEREGSGDYISWKDLSR